MTINQRLAIHTVYKPQENLHYLKDWLEYHSYLGFKKFFMYDNGESFADNYTPPFSKIPLKNKYGYFHDISLKEARNKQKEIFKDFNVDLIPWSPIHESGVIGYGQVEAVKDCLNRNPQSLIAFIDIDEYIIMREKPRHSRLFQKKYHHLKEYSSVREISKCIPDLDTSGWAPKVILDAQELSQEDIDKIYDIHMENLDLPISKSYFNHYNYNEITQQFLINHIGGLDPNFKMEAYLEILKEETAPNDVRVFLNRIC